MTVYAFLGERFSRTHENQAFDHLYRLITRYWGDRDEHIVFIGNVTCNGHELDALLLKPDGIIVIDFKNFGGRIEFTENGPWLADGQEVKGGSKVNPFKQVQANKFAVLEWLEKKFPTFKKSNKLGHIAGLVLFQQSVEFDSSQLPGKVASWFHVGDYSSGFEWLTHLASPGIRLSRDDQDQFVAALNVRPYQLPDDKLRIVDLPDIESGVAHEPLTWTADQQRALELVERLLAQDKPDVLLVTGMASTGKTKLIQELALLTKRAGRDLVPLAPNAALANRLNSQTGLEFRSIFGHLYSFGSPREDENGCLVHPLRSCKDAPNAVYVVDEAHLLSDAYFDLGGERFGSGHTISDFLQFTALGQEKRKLIVLADSYQLSRGGEENGLQSRILLESKQLKVQHHALEQLVDDGTRSGILAAAVDLISSVRAERFSALVSPADEVEILTVDNDKKSQLLRELFAHNDRDAVIITASNQSAHKITDWIRRNIRGYRKEYPQPGDRIELYSLLKLHPNSDDALEVDFIPHGSYGVIDNCEPNPIERLQPLKGRTQPVPLRFRRISVRFDHEPEHLREFLYLEPFLLAEKPELDKDTLVALRVDADMRIRKYLTADMERVKELKQSGPKDEYERAKEQLKEKRNKLLLSDPYYNAARIRYAYACTCHHAQGRAWAEPVVNADYEGQARANQGYFRWLYTALTRAITRVHLANFMPLSPLDGVQWKPQRAIIDPKMRSLFHLQYLKDAPLIEEDRRTPIPKGLTANEPALIRLWLHVKKLLAVQKLHILEIKQYPYQEQYVIEDQDARQATIALRYNGQHDVTAVGTVSGDNGVANTALACLHEQLRFEDPLAEQMLDVVRAQLAQSGFSIDGGLLSNWHFRLTIVDATTSRAAIKVHYSKEGRISTIEVEKATDADVLERLGQSFQPLEAAA